MADKQIPIDTLKIGHYIKLPVGWKDHPFLFNNFKIKNSDQLELIHRLGLDVVTIDPNKSGAGSDDEDIDPLTGKPILTPEQLQAQAEAEAEAARLAQQQAELAEQQRQLDEAERLKKESKSALRLSEKQFNDAMADFRTAIGHLKLKPEESITTLSQLVRSTALKILFHKEPFSLNLIRFPGTPDPMVTHCMNVTFIAMLVAKEADWEKEKIEEAGLVCLLHDIGKLKVPTQITQKKSELTKSEKNFLEMHPQYGKETLDGLQLKQLTPTVREAILHHHEKIDGSGYPHKLKEAEISDLARLIGLIDYFDVQQNQVMIEKRKQPNQVIAMLFKLSNKYDPTLTSALIKVMGPYPPGTVVNLSNGKPAIVVSTQPNDPLKPKVHPFEQGQRPEGVDILDLTLCDITIAGPAKIDDLSQAAIDFLRLEERFCYFYDINMAE
ncbi:HD-GYP domain-containing protein [Dongshaea marina]|uniref:HD-GYP domain-containing protein n=1 Tax=Dongshaea marina TaxID=2047966 RepID=UPI000D3E6124|nr:HD-GYP domain-containing protein [Dongshaea marina]